MKRRLHARAIARLVVAAIETEAPGRQKLRRSRLRCTAERPDESLACELGVLAQVEAARDAHLAALDADDGLAALSVPWQEIVAEAAALLDRPPAQVCARCGARLSRRRAVCGRCRSPTPRPG